MDYTKLTIAELANGISKTEAAIRRCREILDDLHEPKTAGMQAVVKAIRDLLPKLDSIHIGRRARERRGTRTAKARQPMSMEKPRRGVQQQRNNNRAQRFAARLKGG